MAMPGEAAMTVRCEQSLSTSSRGSKSVSTASTMHSCMRLLS